MIDIFVHEDVPGEWTGAGITAYKLAGIPGSDDPIRATSVADMVAKVWGRAGTAGYGSIQTMFIAGHGAAGEQALGIGTGTDNTGGKTLKATGQGTLMGLAKSILPILAPLFAPGAILTLG